MEVVFRMSMALRNNSRGMGTKSAKCPSVIAIIGKTDVETESLPRICQRTLQMLRVPMTSSTSSTSRRIGCMPRIFRRCQNVSFAFIIIVIVEY